MFARVALNAPCSTSPAEPVADVGNRIDGRRCVACGRASALPLLRCPSCREQMTPARFGPEGVVWSSTVVHLDAVGHEAPYALAYLDLDGGPRVLVHVRRSPGASVVPAEVGTRLRLAGLTADGQPVAEPA